MENVRKCSTFLNISRVNIYQVKFVEGSLYKFERIWSASFMSDFPVIWQLGKSQEVQWMKTLNIYDLV